MRTIEVRRTIPAPAEEIFDVLADHARYDRFRPMSGSELLKQGEPPPNGVGAVRRILARPFRFDEEITAYERPVRLDYLIVDGNTGVDHEGGSIRLESSKGWTLVRWTSRFSVHTPVVGGALERFWQAILTRSFGQVLEDVERIVSERDGSAA